MRKTFEVSTKAAIFSNSLDQVLVIDLSQIKIYGKNKHGLPGGHMEENETPDQTIAREIKEECGITATNLKRADFFITNYGKVVLAYIGTANNDNIKSEQDGLEGIPKWVTKSEFEKINIDENYYKFVLENWPSK